MSKHRSSWGQKVITPICFKQIYSKRYVILSKFRSCEIWSIIMCFLVSSFIHIPPLPITAAVILPSLQRLHVDSIEFETTHEDVHGLEMVVRTKLEDKRKLSDLDLEREDECGICLEPCTKMVLPNCCHAMCINCYHNWYFLSFSSFFFSIYFTVNFSEKQQFLRVGNLPFLLYFTGTQGQNLAHSAGEQ